MLKSTELPWEQDKLEYSVFKKKKEKKIYKTNQDKIHTPSEKSIFPSIKRKIFLNIFV